MQIQKVNSNKNTKRAASIQNHQSPDPPMTDIQRAKQKQVRTSSLTHAQVVDNQMALKSKLANTGIKYNNKSDDKNGA